MNSSPISLKECGAIPGLSAAGTTSGLAATGAGSLINGLVITSPIPIAFFCMCHAIALEVTTTSNSDKTWGINHEVTFYTLLGDAYGCWLA